MFFFALMDRKTEIAYKRVLEKVRENVEITCEIGMRDFEKTSINSFIFFNPSTSLTGHHTQRSVQSTLYLNKETVRSIFKMSAAFAFIQKENVIRTYEALKEHICIKYLEQKFR
ncbi:hypothetical protein HZS_3656 [Henneguya salminicola]|nr:hypothetical protein HZS_3656 [Henneguya salminicola]